MGSYQAIAAVSRTLRSLLRDRMEDLHTLPVTVTLAPPDVTLKGITGGRLNLYLFQVTENGSLKNQEIPGQGSPGAYGHPPLSLDLHYLLTSYAESDTALDSDLAAQQILGNAMRVLHDFAIIPPHLHEKDDPTRPRILDPVLSGEFERIKITLQPTSLDDLSKLWSALPQASFRRSATYQVSVVQLESRRPRRLPRPVGEPPLAGPRIHVVSLRRPSIAEVRVRRQGDPPGMERTVPYAAIGDVLILLGQGLAGDPTRVRLGGLEIPVAAPAPDRLEVAVPDDTLPGGLPIPADRRLQPGPQTVEVRIGAGTLPGSGFPSNQAIFLLVPRITLVTPHLAASPRTLTLDGRRLWHQDLSGETLVGSAAVPKNAYLSATPGQLEVPLPEALPASPVRVLVSGDLGAFPNLTAPLEMTVAFGADGPHTVTLATKPLTLEQAAGELQAALRQAAGGGPAFRGARVLITLAAPRLAVVPGGLGDPAVSFADLTAEELRLAGGNGELAAPGHLSGELLPFPVLTAALPALAATVGGTAQTLTLPRRPVSLEDAAALLRAAIRGADPGAGFAQAQVALLGQQLLILPGANQAASFAAIPGTDETSVAELQLRAAYPVRVRVNAAESLDTFLVELPS